MPKFLCEESLVTAFSPPQNIALALQAQKPLLPIPAKNQLAPRAVLGVHMEIKPRRRILEFRKTSGIAHGYGERDLRAGFHHVHPLEEHRHAASFPNKGPAPQLSITEGPAQLTRSCLDTEGHPRGPLEPGNWCKFSGFVTELWSQSLSTGSTADAAGSDADAPHTFLLPSEVTATERRHMCMLRCCFYQHKEQVSVQVTKQGRMRR